MKNLTDYEKIMQVIDNKGIKISKAERMAGLGVGTLSKLPERKDGAGKLNPDNTQKFLRTFNVRQQWWETCQGEIFFNEKQEESTQQKETDKVKVLPCIQWELLQDDNKEFKKEISNLWDMIRYLKGQGVKSHE